MNYITIQQPHKVMGTIFLGGSPTPVIPLWPCMMRMTYNLPRKYLQGLLDGICVVHLQDKVTPSTKALWPGASFQNRSYGDRSSLFWIREDTFLTPKALWPGASFQNRSY
jgi:hypothetical protein